MADLIITGMSLSGGGMTFTLPPPAPSTPTVGGLWLWGRNSYKPTLGDNTLINRSSPVQTVSGGTNWIAASAGYFTTAAIKTDGTLWTWAGNNYGQLGDNSIIDRSSPVQTVAGGTNWSQVSINRYHAAAVKTDGTLWTWGLNSDGQLGINTAGTGTHKSSPVQTVAAGTNWKQVACGYYFTSAIKTDGTLWTWGFGGEGQIGDNTVISKSSPVQTVSGGTNWKQLSISTGQYMLSAIKTDSTLWTWGKNNFGQLGDNTTIWRSSPVQTVAGGTNWKSALASSGIKTDGTLWTWGFNVNGELGDNTTISKSSPVQTIAGGTNWANVAAEINVTAGVKTDGTLWTWGRNNFGQCGDNTTTPRSSPVQTIMGGSNWAPIITVNSSHVAAIRLL